MRCSGRVLQGRCLCEANCIRCRELRSPITWCLQVEQFTNALQRQSVAEAEGAWEGSLPEAAEELADEMAAAALGRSSLSRQISVARDRPGSGEAGQPLSCGEEGS